MQWTTALAGENELCYYLSDELEEYFDLFPGYLRGDEHFAKKHVFTPYPIEEANLELELVSVQEKAQKICKEFSNVTILKNRENGLHVFNESKQTAAVLFKIAAVLHSGNPSSFLLIDVFNKIVDDFLSQANA